jgi:NTP pyrophosphatase (non-canonical NTP hydrolase)
MDHLADELGDVLLQVGSTLTWAAATAPLP